MTDISKEYNISVATVSNLKKGKLKNFTILDALHLLNEAWEMISSDSMASFWEYAGLSHRMNDLVEIIEELDDKLDCHLDEIELSITDFIEDPHSDENEQENDFEESIPSSDVLSAILI